MLAVTTLAAVEPQRLDADDDFLPAEKAFAYFVEAHTDSLTVHWNVAPGYYLYKARMSLDSGTPGITLGDPRFPAGEWHQDDYFGEQEVFRDDFTVKTPILREQGAPAELTVRIHWQGCADAGLCYPPTTWEARVALPASQ